MIGFEELRKHHVTQLDNTYNGRPWGIHTNPRPLTSLISPLRRGYPQPRMRHFSTVL